MDNIACPKVPTVVRKVKKKQVKDESDRMKRAEKKKRRQEKAVANSLAIRSELEKKKQKQKEEQQRLDEEGAAIAEAVALQVLLGEDSDDSPFILRNDNGFKRWESSNEIGLYMGGRKAGFSHSGLTKCSFEGIGWISSEFGDCSFPPAPFRGDIQLPYFEANWGTPEISAGVIAAQAVSSLKIGEDSHVDTILFNRMLRG